MRWEREKNDWNQKRGRCLHFPFPPFDSFRSPIFEHLTISCTTERLHFHFSLSCIGEGNGNPLQCYCLENPRDGGTCWAAVYGVVQSRTRLKWLSSLSSKIDIVKIENSLEKKLVPSLIFIYSLLRNQIYSYTKNIILCFNNEFASLC